MKQYFALSAIAFGLVLILAGTAAAQEAELPPAREVLDRFVEAIGGEKAVRKPKSLEMTGEFSMPANGISGELRLYTMAPDLLRVTIEIPGIGLTQEGYDGRTAWSMDPIMGPDAVDDVQRRQPFERCDARGGSGSLDEFCEAADQQWVDALRDDHSQRVVRDVGVGYNADD